MSALSGRCPVGRPDIAPAEVHGTIAGTYFGSADFQLENFILASAGIVIGMALAYAINLLGPAMCVATIPPAVATRTM